MFRPFLKVPLAMLECSELVGRSARSDKAGILALPAEILDAILDRLEILDRCCVALCCKWLLRHAFENEHLDYLLTQPPREESLRHFFQYQLNHGWVPPELRYCPDCGKFVPTAPFQWRAISEKYSREMAGRVPFLWRLRREDGWLRYWIERWCMSRFNSTDAVSLTLSQEDPSVRVCPRCAVQNPECNKWRILKSPQPKRHSPHSPQRDR